MNPEVKKMWIEALRSGEYEQGKNKLRTDDNKYCCLGVLCDVYRKNVGGKWDGGEFTAIDGSINVGIPPHGVTQWAGWGMIDNPMLGIYTATLWNDHVGSDFNKIADLIEEYL